jgi:colanic acid biosynthesis glycosyl transferase WcaI
MHLLPQSPEAEDLVLPSKLSGMLASGRPVIATCRKDTDIASVVTECGVVVAPGDSTGLAQALMKLADDPALRLKLGNHARHYAETHLASEAVLGRLTNELEALAYGDPLHANCN